MTSTYLRGCCKSTAAHKMFHFKTRLNTWGYGTWNNYQNRSVSGVYPLLSARQYQTSRSVVACYGISTIVAKRILKIFVHYIKHEIYPTITWLRSPCKCSDHTSFVSFGRLFVFGLFQNWAQTNGVIDLNVLKTQPVLTSSWCWLCFTNI